MRKTLLSLMVLFFLGSIFCANDTVGQQLENNHVVAYYFHGNFRCFNCYRIEQYSKEVVAQYFKDELSSGRLVFRVINVEEKENEHFIQDYQLYTKSLIISLIKNSKEVKFNNLVKVWELLGNKQKFYDYVKDEITKYLKEP